MAKGQILKKGSNPQIISAASHSIYRGPLPSPEMFGKYEAILPGAADRILKMAEKQNDNRIKLEQTVIPEQVKQSARGQYFAFILATFMIISSVFLIYNNRTIEGSVFGGVSSVSLLAFFFYGKKSQKQNLEDKNS